MKTSIYRRLLERLLSRFFLCEDDHDKPTQAQYNLVGIWLCQEHAECTIADGSLT